MGITLSDVTNRTMSASGTIIAMVALGTGLYQAKLSRDQAKAAVWPYLISGNSGENGYSRIVQNGSGPQASVRSRCMSTASRCTAGRRRPCRFMFYSPLLVRGVRPFVMAWWCQWLRTAISSSCRTPRTSAWYDLVSVTCTLISAIAPYMETAGR